MMSVPRGVKGIGGLPFPRISGLRKASGALRPEHVTNGLPEPGALCAIL